MPHASRLLLVTLAACLGAKLAAADILIATVGPMTGQYAAFGEQLRRGAEMAVADINAAGGVNGESLTLDVEDDSCDPKQAVAVAAELERRGVKFVAGHFCSGASIPASKIYERAGILQISPASTNPRFTEDGGWNVARLCGRDDAQGTAAGRMLATRYRDKKIAILHDETSYGKGLADAALAALNASGIREALSDTYISGGKDYGDLAAKLQQAAIDVVYVGGAATDGGLLLRALRNQGSAALMVSGDAFVSDEFWNIAGADGEGTLMTFAPDPQKFDAAKDIVERFKAAGYNPEGATLYAYAAIQAYRQAASAVGGARDNRKIAAWLRGGNPIATVLGELTLDSRGDVRDPHYVWYQWHDGKFAEAAELNQ
jgi:branched-chain amino acid transport system substrate-binding protein